MKTLTITESKAQLSALVVHVLQTGKPIVIGRRGQPMVQLAPYTSPRTTRKLGQYAGRIHLAEDFDVWPEEEAEAFGLKDK